MIAAMVNDAKAARSILVVVIEPTNLERMRQADPVTLESRPAGGILLPPLFPMNFSVLIAYEEDTEKLQEMVKEDGYKALKWLERGRRFDPATDGTKNSFIIHSEKVKVPDEEN
jgi:hypothetical protein